MRRRGVVASLAVLVAILCAGLAFAAEKPPAKKNRIPKFVESIRKADAVFILALDPRFISQCDSLADSLRFEACYGVVRDHLVQRTPAPSSSWVGELGDLLKRTEIAPWDSTCRRVPKVIVRSISAHSTSDLVILEGQCDSTLVGLVFVVPNKPIEHGTLGSGDRVLLELIQRAFGRYFAEGIEFVHYDEAPKLVTRIPPTYPESARDSRIEGQVIVHILVAATGRVSDVRVFRGVPGLDRAAIDAVQRWVYRPAYSAGKPVPAWIETPVDFRLSDDLPR